ncbi:DUF2218 domain-containing protein [Kallotenue papyrolyticum]|uniref:DUF2218 domain-containing protein n=1 Tax=Kallotenue papyrolyticum TaxID=1325125 RepID=UPI0004785694|nr:DUF2218 domain-containing protein [Kallotenue papyrolyticum]
MEAIAQITTERAQQYLRQLCRHFAHKVPAACDEHQGQVQFASGRCALSADEQTLHLYLQADDPAALEQLKEIVGRHLLRFAFREPLTLNWQAPSEEHPGAASC